MDELESAMRLDCLHLHVWEDDGGPAPHASADASASGATYPSALALLTTAAAKTPVALLNPAAAPLSATAPNGEGRRVYRYSNLPARSFPHVGRAGRSQCRGRLRLPLS